jgi:uncharacterized membrane protein
MLRPTMRTVLAALILSLIVVPAEAGFKVCNKTPHEAKVALGRFDGTAWTSRGWWTIPAKGCTELLPGALDARYYYLYATDDASGSWDGRRGFCVSAATSFEIRGRADCESHGYDRRGFFQIDTGQARDYTQSLAD